jgi:hypothetical protein
MENFEALGRYHFAKEQLRNNASIRERLLDELKRHVDKAVGKLVDKPVGNSNLDFPFHFASETPLNNADLDKMGSLINQIAEVNQNMLNAIEEINKYAEDAKKSKIEIPK